MPTLPVFSELASRSMLFKLLHALLVARQLVRLEAQVDVLQRGRQQRLQGCSIRRTLGICIARCFSALDIAWPGGDEMK